MIEKLGGRKTIALLIVLIAGTIFTIVNKDMPAQYAQFLEIMFGVYVGGNAASKALYKAEQKQPVTPPGPNAPDSAALEQIVNTQTTILSTLQFIITKSGIDKLP